MHLFHQIATKAGTNLAETNKIIDAFTRLVSEDVARGQEVRRMSFSTWNLRHIAARRVKSIRESHQITIPARKCVGFGRRGALAGCSAAQSESGTTEAINVNTNGPPRI
jgi:DNA-binding protein HU-beta